MYYHLYNTRIPDNVKAAGSSLGIRNDRIMIKKVAINKEKYSAKQVQGKSIA